MGTVWVFEHLEAAPPELIAEVLEAQGHTLSIFRSNQSCPAASGRIVRRSW